MRVGGVLDEVHAALRAQRRERRQRRADEAADVHGDDGRGVGTDRCGDVVEVERHRARVAVDETHARAGVHRRGRGREERVGGDDDLSPVDAERAQDDLERAGSRAHRDRVVDPMARRERLFELAADRSERELPGGERLVDPGQDLGAVFVREEHPGRGHAHDEGIYRSPVERSCMHVGPTHVWSVFTSAIRSPVPSRVVLIGLMASGKSTVGPGLAGRLGLPFVDNDVMLQRRSGRTARDIERVRTASTRCTVPRPTRCSTRWRTRRVIAAAAGAVLEPDAARAARAATSCTCAPIPTCWPERLQPRRRLPAVRRARSTRPACASSSTRRDDAYRAIATLVVDATAPGRRDRGRINSALAP